MNSRPGEVRGPLQIDQSHASPPFNGKSTQNIDATIESLAT
jgi:hypothetical protein